MIHSSTGLSPDGAVAAGHLGLPHVWHLRELVGPTGNVRLRGDRNGQVGRRVARTGVAIANSNTTAKAWFADAVGSVTVVPNGIVVEGLTSIRQTERGSDRLVFGMVANLSSTWKRHEDFVRAAAEVARVLPNSRFVVFGEIPDARDPYVEALRTLVTEYKLGETFEFRGYVQSAVDAMGALDVLVHPSDWESFGRVFIEAGAAGKPVIGVRAGAATEVVVHGETGLLCEPRDPSSLAGSMIELGRSDELRQRLGVGGRARVERLYTIDACASGVMDAYVRATARPTRSLRLADAVLRTMR